MRLFPILLLIIAWPTVAQHTIDSVPNQKLIDGGYVTNPDSIIGNETVVSINNTLRSLEQNTTVQVAVVALKSIGEMDDFSFAQALFDRWKIGHADKDNGLLILLITDARTIRFHTGRGLEGTLPDVVCKQIQRDWMLPDFKNGNYDRGLRLGVYQVQLVLSNPDYANELRSRSNPIQPLYYGDFALYLLIIGIPLLIILFFVKDVHEQFVDSKKSKPVLYPELLIKQKTWFWIFAVIPGVFFLAFWIAPIPYAAEWCLGILYIYFMGTLVWRLVRSQKVLARFEDEKSFFNAVEFLRKGKVFMIIMAIIFPVPFALYFFYHLSRTRYYRRHPRECKSCGNQMRLMDEAGEDEFLTKNQQFEEKIKSVDYDVWKCESCHKTELFNYINRLSSYDTCVKCKTKAVYLVTRRTVTEPTYTATGTGEEIYKCKFCDAGSRKAYTIAMKTEKKDTYGSSGGYSSSGRSGSGGGSWGGGSSGGGGASSRW